MVAFLLKAGDPHSRGHASLLDLAPLGEVHLELLMSRPLMWVSETMPCTLTLDLASVVPVGFAKGWAPDAHALRPSPQAPSQMNESAHRPNSLRPG